MKPDASLRNPSPRYLRGLLDAAGVTPAEAARMVGVQLRTMRSYLSDQAGAPYLVQFALEALAKDVSSRKRSKRVPPKIEPATPARPRSTAPKSMTVEDFERWVQSARAVVSYRYEKERYFRKHGSSVVACFRGVATKEVRFKDVVFKLREKYDFDAWRTPPLICEPVGAQDALSLEGITVVDADGEPVRAGAMLRLLPASFFVMCHYGEQIKPKCGVKHLPPHQLFLEQSACHEA